MSMFENTNDCIKKYIVLAFGDDCSRILKEMNSIFSKNNLEVEKFSIKRDFVEFEVRYGGDFKEIKRKLIDEAERLNFDIIVQPYDLYKEEKKLIVFDMDSTLVDAEIIDEIAKEAGVYEKVKDLTEKAMRGEIDFKTALIERVKLLEGLSVDVLEKIYQRIKLNEGVRELVKILKSHGLKIAVVSGGFSYFAEKLKEELDLDYAFANELEIIDGKITGKIEGEIIDAERKAKIIEKLAKIEGIKLENVIAIGDGANDRLMIEKVGLGIAFNAKDVLKDVADGILSRKNLLNLVNVLGI